MKKILPFILPSLLFLMIAAFSFYLNLSYITTIRNVQEVPDSLLTLGLDRSPKVGDTVTVTGRVIAPPRVNPSGGDFRKLLRGTNSHTAYIQDTSGGIWSGIIVRQGDSTSNTQFDQLDSGMKVTVKGIVQEFPDITSTGATQIGLDLTEIVQILPTIKRRPVPVLVNVTDFDSAGIIQFNRGEKYEGMYVELRNLTIGPQSPSSQRHIRQLIDDNGNYIYLRDFSNFYSASPSPTWGWTPWSPPSVGATVNYIRGVIINAGVTEPPTGLYPYVIVPIYPNDLQIGNTPPFVSNITRNPGIPKPGNVVTVNATVNDTLLNNPVSVDSVQLYYRINKGTYNRLHMPVAVGNIYSTTIPAQPLGTLVEYFVKAKDNQGGIRFNPSDTGRSTYFYRVRNSDTMSIYDIQWTPNNGGFSAYNTYTVTTEGIVTADTTDIGTFAFNNGSGNQTSPRRVVIQDPNIPGGWSGIWLWGGSTTNATDNLLRGHRVRVTGTVEESNGMTRITIQTPGDLTILATGQPLPSFVNLTPSIVSNSKSDGDTTIERWESVLVKFNEQVSVSCLVSSAGTACGGVLPLPDSSFRRNYGELFVIKQGEGVEARIELQDGTHNFVNGWDETLANYYNPNLPGTLIRQWDGFSYLQGVMYYSFGRYKLVPRKNDDFGTLIGIKNDIETPSVFWLAQNYPNPFNPVTTIKYNIPASSEVSLKVYNLLGQVVKTLVDGVQNRGQYNIQFNASDLASGVYIYVMQGETFDGQRFFESKKMVLVK